MAQERASQEGDAVPPAAGSLFGLDCNDAVHQLYFYLDGELTEERRTAIALHLDRCGPCAGAVQFEVELRRVLASRCRDRVPESLRRRVAAAIEEYARGERGGGASLGERPLGGTATPGETAEDEGPRAGPGGR